MIDTHAHIYDGRFAGDIDEVMLRAAQNDVRTVIVPATKPAEFAPVFDLAMRYPGQVRAAIGVHPHHAAEVADEDLGTVERLVSGGGAVAVGEIGLDYYYDFAPRERQIEVFRRQVRIGRQNGLPIVVHTRESEDDVLRVLQEEQDGTLKFQLHCFSGSVETLERALALGAMISFTGNITFKKSTLDDVVRAVPDDRIMIETDAPYMTPVPHRGKRNEPGYVGLVAEKIAGIRGQSIETIMQTTTTNAVRFFRLLILILGLTAALMHSGMNAQIAEPSAPVDTTPPLRPAFRKWLGIGGHIASSTYISNSETIANGVFGKGFWLSLGPLESLELDWLRLDVIYTSVVNNNGTDSVYLAINTTPPTNHHQTLDIKARFIANPRAVISFFGTFGLTNFVNDFGALKWRDDNAQIYGATPYHENLWGIGGSLGLSGNINTPFGTIAPTAEWEIAFMYGERLKNFRGLEFIVSQQRVGILLYPDFQKLFGK